MRLSHGSAIWMAFLTVCLGLSAGRASAQASVEGNVRYDAETVAMSQVSARETRPEATGNEAPQIVVLIADRPPPPDVAKSKNAYYAAAREGRIRGLLLVFETTSNDARLVIFAKGGAEDDRGLPDIFNKVILSDVVHQGGWISGHLKTNERHDFSSDRGDQSSPATYEIDVRFRAQIAPAPKPDSVLTGEAARNSPEALAALQALKLIRTGTAAQVRAKLYPNDPMWGGLGSDQANAILAAARAAMPPPTTFLKSVRKVLVYGDEAVVTETDRGGNGSVSLRRDGGEWKLAKSPIPDD